MTRALAMLLLAVLAAPAGAGDASPARLAAAVAEHPDDRDLSLAYALALHEAGRPEEAIRRLGLHLERWPEHPVDGAELLGRWLYASGRIEEAVAVLEAALVERPGSAGTHLTLGLALKRSGRVPEAERHFRTAADLERELAGEALLLAALARLELGDEAGGESLLRRVVALDPDSPAAHSARLVLDGVSASDASRLRLQAHAGIEYDTNVVLESNEGGAGFDSDETDLRFGFGTLGRGRVFAGERASVDVGARYDGSRHLEHDAYDSDRVLGFLSSRHALRSDLALRLDVWGGPTYLDSDPYLLSIAARPSLFAALGDRVGVLRVFALGERVEYEEDPTLPPFERTGWIYGGGLEHYLPVSIGEERAWISIGGSYTRHDTEADREPLLGFEGDYDRDRWRGTLRAEVPLPLEVRAIAEASFDAELYLNENLTGMLTEFDDDERSDRVVTTDLALMRPLSRFVDVELVWRFTDRDSNIDLFSYDRHVVGVNFRVHTP